MKAAPTGPVYSDRFIGPVPPIKPEVQQILDNIQGVPFYKGLAKEGESRGGFALGKGFYMSGDSALAASYDTGGGVASYRLRPGTKIIHRDDPLYVALENKYGQSNLDAINAELQKQGYHGAASTFGNNRIDQLVLFDKSRLVNTSKK